MYRQSTVVFLFDLWRIGSGAVEPGGTAIFASRAFRCEPVGRRSLKVADAGHRSMGSAAGRMQALRLLHMPLPSVCISGVAPVAGAYCPARSVMRR
jgi:hypothetical protein